MSAQHRGQSAYLLRRTIYEVIHRQPSFGFASAQQIAHVVADPGDPQQTRLLVKHRLHLFSGEPEVLKKI